MTNIGLGEFFGRHFISGAAKRVPPIKSLWSPIVGVAAIIPVLEFVGIEQWEKVPSDTRTGLVLLTAGFLAASWFRLSLISVLSEVNSTRTSAHELRLELSALQAAHKEELARLTRKSDAQLTDEADEARLCAFSIGSKNALDLLANVAVALDRGMYLADCFKLIEDSIEPHELSEGEAEELIGLWRFTGCVQLKRRSPNNRVVAMRYITLSTRGKKLVNNVFLSS